MFIKTSLFILICIFSLGVAAQDKVLAGFDPKTDILSDKYDAGPFLIYDCQEKHWVCVMESQYEDCKLKRSRDLASENVFKHSCSPIGKFPTKKSCFQRQSFLTTHHHGVRFCVKDAWKNKADY